MPAVTPFRILAGGPVRKRPDLLRAHLASLAAQILPPRVTLDFAFMDDNTDPASSAELWTFGDTQTHDQQRTVRLIPVQSAAQDFSDQHAITHQWSADAMIRVGEYKNRLIAQALAEGYDALWLVDSDLILHPRTLWSLYYAEHPIVCGVFWTRWNNTPDCPELPQVWLRHPYELDGRGLDGAEFLRKLHDHELVQVWGQGANTLYRRAVLQKGLTFDRVPGLPTHGMWQGEDRHLCVRAERLHIPMMADAWPVVEHCYHPEQQAAAATVTFPEEATRVSLKDEVSLQLQALEPVPQPDGTVQALPKQHIRGQLGRVALAPEIEAVVYTLTRGEKRIVAVDYPGWSESPYRGQRRLIEVTLVDFR